MTDDTAQGAQPVNGGCFYALPTLSERLRRRLGFRYHLGDEPEGAESLTGWMATDLYFHFGWIDRLRLLASGRLFVRSTASIDTPSPSTVKTRLDWRIFAPGEKR